MAELFALEAPGKIYWDRKSFATFEDHVTALRGSKYLYIGNLSFYTTEAQIIELFSKVSQKVFFCVCLSCEKLCLQCLLQS
jgi:nuclear cap-binding protein subunit 2